MTYLSFIVYLSILFWPVALYVSWRPLWRDQRWSFYVCCYAPAFVFASLRGSAGTDTENYRDAFSELSGEEVGILAVDYLFLVFMAAVKESGLSSQAFLSVQAILCLLLYTYSASRLDKHIPLFGIGLLPVLFVDAVFNGMRYGLAFAVASAVICFTSRNQAGWWRSSLLLIPGLIHSSLLVLLLLLPVGVAIVFVLAGYWSSSMSPDFALYFLSKSDTYSDVDRPGQLSGLMPFVSFLFVLTIGAMSGVRPGGAPRLYYLSIGLFVAGVYVAMSSYAGLRVMNLAVFLLTLAVSAWAKDRNTGVVNAMLLAWSLLAIANYLRQIFFVGEAGGVFFHPYDFFFDPISRHQ
jgi:hypothetical protein